MTQGQSRVLVLLLVLLGLEAIRSPGVKSWFRDQWKAASDNINQQAAPPAKGA
jgi:hypothetical protein